MKLKRITVQANMEWGSFEHAKIALEFSLTEKSKEDVEDAKAAAVNHAESLLTELVTRLRILKTDNQTQEPAKPNTDYDPLTMEAMPLTDQT